MLRLVNSGGELPVNCKTVTRNIPRMVFHFSLTDYRLYSALTLTPGLRSIEYSYGILLQA
jgi:hypothetical protein